MAVSDKQKLFENLEKLNPELKGKKIIKEEYIGEAEQSLQKFLADLGFTDMYNMYKNDPKQLDRIFTKILPANKLKTFKRLLNPGQPVQGTQQVRQKPVPTLEAFVNALPYNFASNLNGMIHKYGEDIIDDVIKHEIENIGGEIGITNDTEALKFEELIGNNMDEFIRLVEKRFTPESLGWGGGDSLEEELDANTIKIYSIDDIRSNPALRSNAANGFLMPIFNKGEKTAFGFIDSPEEYQGPGNVKAVKQLNGKIRIVRGPEYQ
jgi:hypothetical protein